MPQNYITLSRSKLYELVWTKPVTELAKDFGKEQEEAMDEAADHQEVENILPLWGGKKIVKIIKKLCQSQE